MSATNFGTENQTFRRIFGSGVVYAIPRFQRDYSWETDQWDDLWHDIQATTAPGGEPAHYMGYLVLQSRDARRFEVIDGQQRLTTLSILALAVIAALQDLAADGVDAGDNRRRAEELRSAYIGFLDPVTLVPRSKLTLNRNNDGYYQDYIVPLQPLPRSKLRPSQALLRRAFEWFRGRVRDQYGAARDGRELARFLDTLADKLFFTVITVTDELNAFKVFETLNARGVRLSPADLLKNYLFSVVQRETRHQEDIDALERRWDDMAQRLGADSLPDFLRAHWNSRRAFVREADLFKTVRNATPDRAAVFGLIRAMEADLEIYTALSRPEDGFWTREQSRDIRALRHFNVRQPWPLLMAAKRQLDQASFDSILRACVVITFRANVITGSPSNLQERAYNGAVQRIVSGEYSRAPEVIRGLGPVYVGDDQFKAAFSDKVLRTTAPRNHRVARYILVEIERHLTQVDHDADNPQLTLEHVLPERPGDNWGSFAPDLLDEAPYLLGNLTLLEDSLNRRIGNADFATKRSAYEASVYDLTQRIARENAEWTLDRLVRHQRWLAVQASAVWRISQLG